MRWNEYRHFAVFEIADANAAQPARVRFGVRFRVGSVDNVVLVDGKTAGTAEVSVFPDKFSFFGENHDAMVMSIGDDEPAARVELQRVRRAELAGPRAGFADGALELSILIEHGDAPDQIGVGDVCVAFCD